METYLTFSLYLFSFISIIIFTIIVIYHIKQNHKNKKIKELKDKYYPIIENYLNNQISLTETKKLIKKDLNYEIIVEISKPLLKKYSGQQFQKLIFLFKKIGLNNHYLKKIYSNNKKKRIKAAVVLGKLKDDRALNKLNQMLNSQDSLVIIAAAWAISDIGNREHLNKIINSLINKTNMTYEAITELLVNYDNKICDNLIKIINQYLKDDNYLSKHFAVSEFKLLALFIDIFGYFRYKQSLSTIKKLIEKDLHDEVIIHILKTLVKIGEPIYIDFAKYLTHNNWVIRSQTAKYLGVIKISKHVDNLINLLSDENWWVRYYAAKAIWNMERIDLMVDIIIKNKSGANICDYILAENNYDYVLEAKR